jgi:hypothetical protein
MKLSPEAIHEFFSANTFPQERSITVLTGQGGMEMFNTAMQEEALRIEKANNKDFAHSLVERKLITGQQKDTIVMMIDSSDPENYEVAKALLEQINSEHVRNLHSKRS